MFIEPHLGGRTSSGRAGWIEVISGCMFSGKTEELIRRLNRAIIAKQKVEIFKPTIDKRYHNEQVLSHNENSIRSSPVQIANDSLLLAGGSDVVGMRLRAVGGCGRGLRERNGREQSGSDKSSTGEFCQHVKFSLR